MSSLANEVGILTDTWPFAKPEIAASQACRFLTGGDDGYALRELVEQLVEGCRDDYFEVFVRCRVLQSNHLGGGVEHSDNVRGEERTDKRQMKGVVLLIDEMVLIVEKT